jgi:hypothetical protein
VPFGPWSASSSRVFSIHFHTRRLLVTEKALVDNFVAHVSTGCSPWTGLPFAREFEYQRGRADVVTTMVDGTVVAFEAKLTRWRDALQQAYRNRCFAHRSYVVLPMSAAGIAHQFLAEFQRRQVGLCYVGDEGVVVLVDSPCAEPLQPWLSSRAAAHAENGRNAPSDD